jgi:PfaD family protein
MTDAPTSASFPRHIGTWRPGGNGRAVSFREAIEALGSACYAVDHPASPRFMLDGEAALGDVAGNGLPVLALAPPGPAAYLGDAGFRADHGLRFNYYAGAMANGIASEGLVEAMGHAGLLGFFGAAGLSPARIEAALARLTRSMAGKPFGFNLINSPGEPRWQEEVAGLYLRHGVRLVEASAYVALSLPLVHYRVHGIHRDAGGAIVAPNRIIAKLSRVEVAERFFSPPPEKMLRKLVESGSITEEQARLAEQIPVAQDVTMEADSGGHTDHRAAITALPTMLALRDAIQARHAYACRLRVGLGGGIATPAAAAAAFAMGADYIMTGSINQACVESGSSDLVRGMLAEAAQTDVGTAPAADMFEMGVTVQVLKKGTQFVTRSNKLYEIYRSCESLEAIPAKEREKIEAQIFRAPLEEVWAQTRAFFAERDPKQVEKAEANPKHKMALVFRWYLGLSSRWANEGVADRREDFQVWCGPAMGAFNEWVRGSFLEAPAARSAPVIAMNLIAGAAAVLRAATLRRQGIALAPESFHFSPRPMAELESLLGA